MQQLHLSSDGSASKGQQLQSDVSLQDRQDVRRTPHRMT
jgi:hypothetical protein